MKIQYGQLRASGKRVFNLQHKFARGIALDDKHTMIMRAVIRKFPDAGDFEIYTQTKTQEICGGRFTETEKTTKTLLT